MSGDNLVIKNLPKSAKLIVNYMKFEHLINNKSYLTFADIVNGTGLSPRTIRKALTILKDYGLVKAVIDISRSRKYLYRLVFKNIVNGKYEVNSGLYIVDLGIGITQHMTFKMYRVIRQTNLLYYTDHVPETFFELIKHDCTVRRLNDVEPEEFKREVYFTISSKGIVTMIVDMLVDSDKVNKYLNALDKNIPVHYVTGVSPLQLAVGMLLQGIEKKVSFKRGNTTIKILVSKCRKNYLTDLTDSNGKLIKSFMIYLGNGNEIILKEVSSNCEEIDSSGATAYILYLKAY